MSDVLESGASVPPEVLRELEDSIGRQPMFGMALGSLLNDVAIIDLINGRGQWSAAKRLRWLMKRWSLCRRKVFHPALPFAASKGTVLVTWRSSTSRIDGLLKPVIEELGPERCTVIYEKDSVVPQLPRGAGRLQFFAALPHEPEIWTPEFRRCWPAWNSALKTVCRRFGLPAAAYQRLAIELVGGSQSFVGCRQLLQAFRPAAVVTEHDRCVRWSPLILAARSLGIPTFTLQHGVIGEQGIGYAPLVADTMFCWGETSREMLIGAGVPPEQLLIGGCPRLDRRLAASPCQGRAKLGLDPAKPVVMLATAPYSELERMRLVEMFAGCMERLPDATGIVRLHPSEKLEDYAALAQAHPAVRFVDNGAATLDESLAASEVIVVQSSGIGSDALVKGRLTVVADLPPAPLGHGLELVEQAQCPCTKTSDELLAAVRELLFDDAAKRRHRAAADRFVDRFCSHFGRESARRIAGIVGGTCAASEGICG